jgi:SSS family solute:Na+ symporter
VTIHPIDLVIVICYLLLMLYLGYRGMTMSKTSDDYLVAGRRLGYGMYIPCMAAVVLGGASTVGGTKLGYEYGISGMWMVVMIGLGIITLGFLLSTKLANLRIVTLSEMLELRYDDRARLVSAVIMAAYSLMISVVQVIAIGTIISVMSGWSLQVGILAGGSIVLIYTLMGGMWSVSLTDFTQFWLMTAGIFFLLVPIGLMSVGGWQNLTELLPDSYSSLSSIGYDAIFSYFLLFFLGLIIGQDIWQRVFTARDARVAGRGTVVAGLYCLAYAVAGAVIGMVAAVKFPNLADPQLAFGTVAIELLPAGVSGLVLAGSLSALMSTADSPLLGASTLAANDIYRRFVAPEVSDIQFLRFTRIVTGIMGIVVIVCALWIQDVIKGIDVAYTLLSGSIFAPVIAGFFWKRANATGTLISMCISATVAIVGMAIWGIGSNQPIMLGIAASVVTIVIASLLTAPPDHDHMQRWHDRLTREQ